MTATAAGFTVGDLLDELTKHPRELPATDVDGAPIINAFASTLDSISGPRPCVALEVQEHTADEQTQHTHTSEEQPQQQ